MDGKSVWAGGATVAQKLEPPEYQLPTVPSEDVEPEACADGIHVGENVVIGQRAATCTEPGYTGDTICGACGEVLEQGAETRTVPHQYGGAWQMDETSHWQVCQICGAKSSAEPHVFEQTEEPAPPELEFRSREAPLRNPLPARKPKRPGPNRRCPMPTDNSRRRPRGKIPTQFLQKENPILKYLPRRGNRRRLCQRKRAPGRGADQNSGIRRSPASDESQPDINPGSTGGNWSVLWESTRCS